jgi:hypothetical protein
VLKGEIKALAQQNILNYFLKRKKAVPPKIFLIIFLKVKKNRKVSRVFFALQRKEAEQGDQMSL